MSIMKDEAHDDISIEPEDEGRDGFGRSKKEKDLRQKLKKCEEEKKEYLAGWQRAKADLVNRNKELEKERALIIRRANEDLVADLSNILGSFDMAFANKESWEKVDETWRRGVEYIYKEFIRVLSEHGLEEINPDTREPFDPEKHDAVGMVVAEKESDEGTIASLERKGYALNGRVIQAARVKVFERES